MADRSINELEAAASVGVADLFVLEQSATAKKLTGQTLLNDLAAALDGHGGISGITYTEPVSPSLTGTLTITLADETTVTLPVVNGNGITGITWESSGTAGDGQLHTGTIHYADGTTGTITIRDGYKGDTGAQTYVHIRWAEQSPQTDSDVLTTPGPWIGIYAGLSSDAPTDYTAYTWYEYKGATGDTGNGITNITRTSSSGLVDVYTVSMTDGSTYTFTVVNGNGITGISGPVSSGLQDTYTINFDSGVSQPFTVTNGDGIASIVKTATSGLLDTYTITLTSGTTYTFQVRNAKSIVSITQIGGSHAAGTTDTYQILYTDGDTSFFTVYNGANGTGAVSSVSGIQADGQGNVPQIITGNGAPTPQTVGQLNQLFFDLNNSVLYFCLGESGGSYNWAGTTVTVDASLSTSSTNPVENRAVAAKVGTVSLDTTAQNLSEAVNEVLAGIPDSTSDLTNDSGFITEAQAPVQSVNGLVGRINLNALNVVCVGDSYLAGWTPDGNVTPWGTLIAQYSGWTVTNVTLSGAGFGQAASGKRFAEALSDYADSLSESQRSLVTTIIGAGGCNDISASVTDIETGISAFCSVAHAKFPNASIYIAEISKWKNSAWGNAIHNVVMAYSNCGQHGARYIANSETILWGVAGKAMASDIKHPNSIGQEAIARKLIDGIMTGSCNNTLYEPLTLTYASPFNSSPSYYAMVNNGVTIIYPNDGGGGMPAGGNLFPWGSAGIKVADISFAYNYGGALGETVITNAPALLQYNPSSVSAVEASYWPGTIMMWINQSNELRARANYLTTGSAPQVNMSNVLMQTATPAVVDTLTRW